MAAKVLENVSTKRPSLEAFDEKITHLTTIKNDIALMKTSVDIGWLRVSVAPFIQKLQSIVTLWIDTYTGFLMDNTVQELKNIDSFIADVSTGIKVIPKAVKNEQDEQSLMTVMGHLRDVKSIKERTFNEIEPMRQTVMLLKRKEFKMDDDYLVRLENSKTKLVEVSELALGPVKEQILPLQTLEAKKLVDKLRKFEISVGEFRGEFLAKCPFHITDTTPEIIDGAYETVNEYYRKTCEM